MQIDVRHVKFFKQLSRETIAFSANVYVNNKRLGEARNAGDGGATRFELLNWTDKEMKALWQEADEFCKQMPDYTLKVPAQFKVPGNEIKVKMDFIEFIDIAISNKWDALEEKRLKEIELKSFRRKQELL